MSSYRRTPRGRFRLTIPRFRLRASARPTKFSRNVIGEVARDARGSCVVSDDVINDEHTGYGLQPSLGHALKNGTTIYIGRDQEWLVGFRISAYCDWLLPAYW
jgi:hypothetical protein